MTLERECEDGRIEVRCSVCHWPTWFSVDVIHEVHDEAMWICQVCNGRAPEWNGFVSPDPFPSSETPTVKPPRSQGGK